MRTDLPATRRHPLDAHELLVHDTRVTSSLCLGVICVALVACGGQKDWAGQRSDKERDAPIRIAFGDCTSSPVPFVSGPRPLPLQAGAGEATARNDAKTGLLGTIGPGRGGASASQTGSGDPSSGFDDASIYGGLLGDDGGSGGGSGQQPTTVPGQPIAQGDLDKAAIRRAIKGNLQKIQYCYEKQLLARPTLAGKVVVQFYILPSGKVASATASGVDPEVASCVADVIKAIEFPRPKHGGVQVNYPFNFRTADVDPTAPFAPAGSGAASAAAADPRSAAAPPSPPVSAPYQPGARDPLRQVEPQLAACLRGAAYGAMTVDLELDPTTGQATRATPATTDTKLAECIAAAARTVKLDPPGPTLQRCGFAYGVMPAAAVPTIAITATDVMFNGKIVDHPANVLAGSSSSWKIAALFDALDAWQKQPRPQGAVPIRGPGLLEPLDQTPMKIVTNALSTASAAAADFVLAAQRGPQWVPLRAGIVLPVAPVPLGSGGTWSGAAIAQDGHPAVADERVVLSVLVTGDAIWISMSRVNEFRKILGRDFARLEQAFKEYKTSAFFTDRTDIEIAGADDVVYGDVVQTIELAAKAGFTDWKVLPPAALAARPGP
jgi:hypothetical protein